MPSQRSVPNRFRYDDSSDEEVCEDFLLRRLRVKEYMAYHHMCEVFRAQGRLTPEKLKLLKEIASALSIPEDRHKIECKMAVADKELGKIAECVAGPNTDVEWWDEAADSRPPSPEGRVMSAALPLADALVKIIHEARAAEPNRKRWHKIIQLRTLQHINAPASNKAESKPPTQKINNDEEVEVITLVRGEDGSIRRLEEDGVIRGEEKDVEIRGEEKDGEIRGEEKDGESSSSVSTTSEAEDVPTLEEFGKEEKIEELEKEARPELDSTLKPPLPVTSVPPASITSPSPSSPVINIPHSLAPAPVESPSSTPNVITVPPSSSIITLPSSPSVITVPPSSSILTHPPTPAVITVPPSSSLLALSPSSPAVITVPPPTSLTTTSIPVTMSIPPPPVIKSPPSSQSKACEIDEGTPVLSDDMQFVSLSDSMDSSLPPLVVVPPPEPVITVAHSSSLMIPSGMSIQLREEGEDSRKRKRSLSQDSITSTASSAPSPKTMTFSHLSKMTPVMVSVANVSAAGLKYTSTMSRTMSTVTSQSSLPTSTQKVIIVSNASSGCAPVMQRSLNVPMGVPFIRAPQPHIQLTPASSGMGKVRPRMVTVPARCRARSNPLVIPVSGHNLHLKNTFSLKQDNVTVVDTSDKKRVLLGSTTPNKILPKPQTPMFIMNTSQGSQKISTGFSLQAEGQARTLSRVVDGPGARQNVVILQKGSGKPQRVTLTNTSKDLMQKFMSKKCVVIQSAKALPKSICAKSSPTVSAPTSSNSNVVVLDLSQEQYRQNLSSTTLAEILKASGILAVSSASATITSTPPHTTSVAGPEPSNWLSLEASKSLALEEVTLPLGQSESIVTLDEAVELLGETVDQPGLNTMEVETQSVLQDPSEQMYTITPDEAVELLGETVDQPGLDTMEVETQSVLQDPSEQMYTITPDLVASNVTLLTEGASTSNLSSTQFVVDQPAVVEGELMSQQFATHKDGAVTIQHSNIDMPANMSLEEYSSQQFENQGLN